MFDRYIWIDKDKADAKQRLLDVISVLLENDYQCVVKDECCGYAVYFVFNLPEMGEDVKIITDTDNQYVVTEDDMEARYNEGRKDAFDLMFEELKLMASSDLYEAMKNACDYKEE